MSPQPSANVPGLAKYSAPHSSHWLKRPRLFERLDALAEQPVVWVSAPAGYGKTVLAAHYLTERKRAVLWYRIDDRDMDPGAFFHRLREAAIQYGLQGAETLPALTAEYAGGEQAFVRNFVEHLLAEAPVGFTLVLDDFQQLPESAPLQDLIPALFESSPSACNIFVLSRHDPAASLARLRANRCIGVLPETALRFDESETAELVAAWPGIEFGQFPVKALQARMQGWAAGLVLTLERHGEGLGEGPVAPDTGILFDYFAAEVVGALSRQERDLLLVTALPSHFDACLARELSGNPKASELIQALLRRNFFVYQEGNTYRYHPLFRDYLLRSAELDWDAETLAGKRLDAARRLLDGQEREMALPLFRDAADWESFVGLIVELAPAMMEQGRYKELERWLQCVPELGPEVPPWIDFWLATSRLPTDYATSYELYSRTYDQFMSQGNTLGAVYSWIGAVDAIIFSLSVVSRLDRWLQQLETLLSDTKVEPDNPLRGQLASRVMTILTLRYPEHPELPNWLAIAEQTLDRIPEINQRTMSAFYLCTYYIWRGDLDLAADLIQRIAGGVQGKLPPLAATTQTLAQAWLAWTSGRDESCREDFRRGLRVADVTGVHVWTYVLWMQGVTNALIHGDLAEADAYLQNIEPMTKQMRDMDQAYYFIDRAWAELTRGDNGQALSYQKRALQAAERFGAVHSRAEAHFGMAQVCHELGDPQQALSHLKRAVALGEQFGSWTLSFQCRLARAYFLLCGGERAQAADQLRLALGEARVHGLVTFNGWRPAVMARLCALALEQRIESRLVGEIIRRFGLTPPDGETGGEWPWPVKIYTLGRFVLEIDGEAIDLAAGKHRRPCILLKHLVASEPHGIAETMLADTLWPDADGDMAMRNLRTNLHRLRKLLGSIDAVKSGQGRLKLNPHYAWTDLRELYRLSYSLDGGDALRASQRLTHLLEYHGICFLPDDEGELISECRHRLNRRMVQTGTRLSELLRDREPPDATKRLLAQLESFVHKGER